MVRLAAEQIPLTMCPLSNVKLRVFKSLQGPQRSRRMLSQGLRVTINSDDPAYFGGYVDDNFQALERELGLDGETLRQLAANSFRASFPGARAGASRLGLGAGCPPRGPAAPRPSG